MKQQLLDKEVEIKTNQLKVELQDYNTFNEITNDGNKENTPHDMQPHDMHDMLCDPKDREYHLIESKINKSSTKRLNTSNIKVFSHDTNKEEEEFEIKDTFFTKFQSYLPLFMTLQIPGLQTNLNIFQECKFFQIKYKMDDMRGLILWLIFWLVILSDMATPIAVLGQVKSINAYENMTADNIVLDLQNPNEFPLFFQLRVMTQPSPISAIDLCKIFNNKSEQFDFFQLYYSNGGWENNGEAEKNYIVDFNCLPDPIDNAKGYAIFRFYNTSQPNSKLYHKFKKGKIHRIEVNFNKTLDFLKGHVARIYACESSMLILNHSRYENPNKTMIKLSTYNFTFPLVNPHMHNPALQIMQARPQQIFKVNYENVTGMNVFQRAWARMNLFKNTRSMEEFFTFYLYDSQRYTQITKPNLTGIRFDLMIQFKVKSIEIKYNEFSELLSAFGGSYSTYGLLLVVIPSIYFMPKKFHNTVAKHIFKKKKYLLRIMKSKYPNYKGHELPTEEEIKEKYLQRVSHEGIYNLHEKVKDHKEGLYHLNDRVKEIENYQGKLLEQSTLIETQSHQIQSQQQRIEKQDQQIYELWQTVNKLSQSLKPKKPKKDHRKKTHHKKTE